MDDNEKRLEILRRTKKRRKQVDITFILAALAVLFLLAGIYLGQAVYYILFVACVLSAVLMIVDLRRTKRQLEEQDRREQERTTPDSSKIKNRASLPRPEGMLKFLFTFVLQPAEHADDGLASQVQIIRAVQQLGDAPWRPGIGHITFHVFQCAIRQIRQLNHDGDAPFRIPGPVRRAFLTVTG